MSIRRTIGSSLLALAVVVAPQSRAQATMSRGAGATGSSEPMPARVVVDGTEVGTMSVRRLDDVAVKATRAVVDAGLPPDLVRITFVEIDPVEVLRGVRVKIDTPQASVADPEGDSRGRLLASCTACSDQELAGLAIEAMIGAIELHEDALEAQRVAEAEAARAAAAAAESASEPRPPLPPVSLDHPPRRGPGPLGWSGVAVLGLGAGAMVTGAVLASRRPAPFPGELRVDELRDVRPAGYAVLGVAVALLVTGAVLLVVDGHRTRLGRVSRAPWLGPRTLGVAMTLPP